MGSARAREWPPETKCPKLLSLEMLPRVKPIVSYLRKAGKVRAPAEPQSRAVVTPTVAVANANNVFSSGGDIAGFLKEPRDGMADMATDISAPERARKPVIAAIEKFALGVAFELALLAF